MDFPSNPQIDGIFKQWNKPDSPGMALAVSKGDEIVYMRGYGTADLDHHIPNEPSTVFHAASLTKQFTAMAIMLLVDAGKLSLDTEVHTLVPQLKSAVPLITLAQMLHHISGIRDQWVLATMAGWRLSDDVVARDDVVERFVAGMKSVNFDPGSSFSYSNTNYTLAGEIVRTVSGVPLSQFCNEHIFKPLGMTRSVILETHGQIVKHRAYGYLGTYPDFQIRMPNYDLNGPTNLQTTVEDLMRWNRNFDLKKVGGEAALSAMLTTAPASSQGSEAYGLGLYVGTDNGYPVIEHDGRDAGYRSHFIRFPEQKLAIALLSNLALPDADYTGILVRKVASVYLGIPLTTAVKTAAARPARAAAPADLSGYLGSYYSDEIDSTYHINQGADRSSIAIFREKYPPTDLIPIGGDMFIMLNFSVVLTQVMVQFDRDATQTITAFRMDDISGLNRLSAFRFAKIQ
jgi:CubicO group peptidase (beta-lactamase class C family)